MGLFDKMKAKFLENDSTEKDTNRVDRAKQAGSVSAPKQTAFSMPNSPDRFVEGASGSREEPTLDNDEIVSTRSHISYISGIAFRYCIDLALE